MFCPCAGVWRVRASSCSFLLVALLVTFTRFISLRTHPGCTKAPTITTSYCGAYYWFCVAEWVPPWWKGRSSLDHAHLHVHTHHTPPPWLHEWLGGAACSGVWLVCRPVTIPHAAGRHAHTCMTPGRGRTRSGSATPVLSSSLRDDLRELPRVVCLLPHHRPRPPRVLRVCASWF